MRKDQKKRTGGQEARGRGERSTNDKSKERCSEDIRRINVKRSDKMRKDERRAKWKQRTTGVKQNIRGTVKRLCIEAERERKRREGEE